MLEPLRSTTEAVRALLWEDFSSSGPGLCQQDASRRLGVDRATVSRALRRLRSSGEVKTRRDHVSGHAYRVLVYQLTVVGRERAQRLLPSPLRDLPPAADLFVGRTRELAQIRGAVQRGGIIVVDGVPGVGKSALVRRAIGPLSSSHIVIWSGLQPGTSPTKIADQLAEAAGQRVEAHGADPGSLLPEVPALSTESVSSFLQRHPKGVVWVLDDVQFASAPSQDAIRDILTAFVPGGRHVAFVITRSELPWPLPQGAAAHLTLKGLPRKDAITLTTALGLPEERFESLFRETLGMPRYLRLTSRVGVSSGSTFANAVLSSLPPHQRTALLPLALSWGPIPLRSGLLPGLTPDEVEALVSLSILDSSDEGLQLPEPVAKRLAETGSWTELREAHRFLSMSQVLSPAERFVHASKADEHALAYRLLTRHRNELIVASNPLVQEAALHLSNQLKGRRRRGQVLLLLAELQRVMGDFVASSTFLQRAFENLPPDDPSAVHAAALLSLTSLRAGHLDQAERWASVLAGLGHTHRWAAVAALARGNVATYRGDLVTGERYLREAETLARRRRQPEIRIMALHGLVHIAWTRKEHERSLRLAQEGARLARQHRRADFVRTFEIAVSTALGNLGRHEEAMAGFQRSLVEARASGDRPRAATLLVSLGHRAGLAGDVPQAIRSLRDAVREAEAGQDVSTIAMTYAYLAWWLRKDGKFAEGRALVRQAHTLARQVGPSPGSTAVEEILREITLPTPPSGRRSAPLPREAGTSQVDAQDAGPSSRRSSRIAA